MSAADWLVAMDDAFTVRLTHCTVCGRRAASVYFDIWAAAALQQAIGIAVGSVTKRLLCNPIQSTYACKTRGEERGHCPPRGEADAHNSPSMPYQDALPCAFEAVSDSNLFVTLPGPHVIEAL